MFAKERLYLTADRKKIVQEGDKRAAFLYAGVGDEIPDSAAQRFGLKDGRMGKGGAATPPAQRGGNPATGVKEAPPSPNKERAPGQDKEKKPDGDKAPAADDLTRVKYVGGASAKALAGAGFTSFAQLAAIDPANPPAVEGMGARVNWGAIVASAIGLHEAEPEETEA